MSVVSKQREPGACMYPKVWEEAASVLLGWHLGLSFALSPTFCLLHPNQHEQPGQVHEQHEQAKASLGEVKSLGSPLFC